MHNQIDYQDLIDELKDEVGTGSLDEHEIIQVLRSSTSETDGYHPIIDWYYSEKTMEIELTPSEHDDKTDKEELLILKKQYEKDKPNLEEMTVSHCLAEMFSKSIKKEKKGKGKGNRFF